MQYTIRLLTQQDLAAVQALYAEIGALHADALPDRFSVAPMHDTATLMALIDEPSASLLVAEDAGQIVGLLELRVVTFVDRPPLTDRTFLSIESLIVGSHSRRRGVGRTLMAAAEQSASERGIDTIELNVYVFNTVALDLYRQLGYTPLAQRLAKHIQP
jgi:ribosomal protein S18 acetylase RimI-like enzyme